MIRYNEPMDTRSNQAAASQDDLATMGDGGDVDLSLIEFSLSLTLHERARRHYHARLFAQRMRLIARQRYGSIIDDLEAPQ